VDTTNPNVLVGVTGDHEIDAALDYAAAAMRRGCGVHLVHVQHPGYLGRSAAVDLRMIDGDVRMAGVDVLGRAASYVEKLVDETVPVSTELVRGGPRSSPRVRRLPGRPAEPPQAGTGPVSALSVTSGVAGRAHAPVVVARHRGNALMRIRAPSLSVSRRRGRQMTWCARHSTKPVGPTPE
jgi:hypothetical protein